MLRLKIIKSYFILFFILFTIGCIQGLENDLEPKIVKSSNSEVVFSNGGDLAIFCIAHGFPRPSIQWFRNGEHYEGSISESQIGNNVIKSMIEIEDAT
uniref:Ig-like domain-containing protein n=1 Tax=Megaselia scalaris TaxID=36166 RepID=T1GV06_MEGSC